MQENVELSTTLSSMCNMAQTDQFISLNITHKTLAVQSKNIYTTTGNENKVTGQQLPISRTTASTLHSKI